MEVDDQAILIILMGLPEDIYAAVDSCETAQEIWRRQMQMTGGNEGNQFRQYAGQNVGNQNGYNAVQTIGNQVVQNVVQNPAVRAEGNEIGNNGNQIRYYNCIGLGHLARNCTARPRKRDDAYLQTQLLIAQKEEARIQLQADEFDFMAIVGDLDEIEEVNENCILMANLQQASTSSTQIDKAPIDDSDGSAEYNRMIVSVVSSMEQSRGTVEQNPAIIEETRAYFESIYNNLAIEVEKFNTVNHKMKETNAELTIELVRYKYQEKCFEINQEKYDKLERCYHKFVYQEQCLTKKINALHLSSTKMITTLNEEIANLNNELSKEKSTVSSHQEEKKKLKSDFKIREDKLLDKQIQLENNIKELDNILEAAKFVQDFKSLAKEADESLTKHKAEEFKIERLLRAVVSQDIMSIVQSNFVVDTSSLQKYDKISYDKAYNDMQPKIEWLQAQLGDLKGKSKDMPCVSDTLDPLSQKLENENGLPKIDESHALSKLVTSNSVPTPQESKVVKNNKVIAPGMFRINPFKTSREEKYVPNKPIKASVRTNPIDVLQPHVITKKHVNSDSNGLFSTGVDVITKTRRPQPRSNTKNDRVPSASKNSCLKNKEVEVEEHHRNLLLSKNKKHMSYECNNVKLAIRNDKSEVVCAMCKQFLIIANHDVYVLNYVNGMNSRGTVCFGNDHVAAIMGYGDLQCGNILITRVYFVEGLGHNLFSVRKFCDSDLEFAFRRNTFVSEFSKELIYDYSRYTWVHFLRSRDKALEEIKTFLKKITVLLNQTLVEAARTMLIFSRVPLFLWAKAVATACYTQNRSIIHRCFNITPYELINGRKPDISFLHVFGALCYPKNDREDIGKLGANGDIGFFIGYSANSCAYRVYNQRTKKIIETMNVTIGELSAMAFEQRSSKPRLQSMTSGEISSGLDLTYASLTITTKQPTKHELDLLFEAMYNDYICSQPSAATRTTLDAQAPQVL
ncbi:retrovirus-related pol polyprotein from transposon TNT 1-94 [Tanacetum coccineum]